MDVATQKAEVIKHVDRFLAIIKFCREHGSAEASYSNDDVEPIGAVIESVLRLMANEDGTGIVDGMAGTISIDGSQGDPIIPLLMGGCWSKKFADAIVDTDPDYLLCYKKFYDYYLLNRRPGLFIDSFEPNTTLDAIVAPIVRPRIWPILS